MKRKLWTLLLALGAALALCVGASATDFSTGWDEVTNSTTTLESGKQYYLNNDVTVSQTITVSGTVILDLNGHVLKYENDQTHGGPLAVESGGHLTIIDSNSNALHKFKPNSDGLWVLDENGSETVTGGVITGGTGYQYQKVHPNGVGYTEEAGGGVCVKVGGKLTMEGGNIVGCSAMSGKGGGVYVEGNFSMTGGSLTAESTVRWCTALLRWDEGGAGCIIWRDIAPGLVYSLTTDSGASEDALSDMAALVFQPAQEES